MDTIFSERIFKAIKCKKSGPCKISKYYEVFFCKLFYLQSSMIILYFVSIAETFWIKLFNLKLFTWSMCQQYLTFHQDFILFSLDKQLFRSLNLYVYVSINLSSRSLNLYIYVSIYLSSRSLNLYVYVSINLSSRSLNLYVYVSINLSSRSLYLYVYVSINLSSRSLYLYVYVSIIL